MRFSLMLGIVLLSLVGCGGGSGSADAGADGGSANAAEIAACRNLFMVDPSSGCASGTEAECRQYLASLRTAEPTCTTQQSAYVACLDGLTVCASGQQCPVQFATYDACADPSGAAIIGTWGMTTCLPPDANTCDYTITFAADGSYSNRSSFVKDAASSTGFEGCTIVITASGYSWTATATTVSVAEGPTPMSTASRTGCLDPADDFPTAPNPDFTPVSYTFTDQPYTISGNQLTLGGAGGLVFTRR
jgi:hypothetical protein